MRIIALPSVVCWPTFASALDEPAVPTPSNYGGVGVLDTRSARVLPDGYLSVSGEGTSPDHRFSGTFEALPWAEVTFRYTVNQAFGPRGGQALYDRSFDFKFRLANEGEFVPQIAIGAQDIIGTGVYSGEYLVASKMVGPFDVSMGLGWGRLASRGTFQNPFGLLGSSFKTRPADGGAQGGLFRLSYFRGPDMGLFGSLEYRTPIEGLKLQVEYSSDAYKQERQISGRDYSYPVNFGIAYQALSWLNVGVSLMHGRDIGLRVSTFIDPTAENFPVRLDRPPRFKARDDEVVNALERRSGKSDETNTSAPETRFVDLTAPNGQSGALKAAEEHAPPSPTDKAAAPPPAAVQAGTTGETTVGGTVGAFPDLANAGEQIEAMKTAVAAQRLDIMGIVVDGDRARVEVENPRYRRDAEAIARTARALSATAPADINIFEITMMRNGQPLTTVVLPRSELDALARSAASPAELWYTSTAFAALAEPPIDVPTNVYPRFTWDISPTFTPSLFDPNNPFYFRIGVGIAASAEIVRGLFVEGFASASLYDNFNEITRTSNSVLPHVRSDIAEYLKHDKYAVDDLTTSYYFKFSPTVYARVSAGILEQMYDGAGGEILYRPFGQRWAIGADMWAVRQRGFDDLFDVRSYETLTGHFSAYYQLPWHDIELAIHAGRYLAKDYGATFEASRSFSTGVSVGAWFTLTNVSAARFGEGSFDKGIRIVIPLEWAAPFSTRSDYTLDLRPIQRDGGQRLYGTDRLYNMTAPSDYGALSQQWSSVFTR